ncbi:MAG: transcriptional regulator [Alphaproteobacteria bacterium CG11_big_fil_rev_8_21_14_0_20_39_49]|nr:MAG: transcriptional regulator [Alphaproteobacteria bacterium CG11_big_fil_rev_8_21_14_0_20_39_49]
MDGQILRPEDMGVMIREARKVQGLTQADLAAISNTNRRFISEIERGKATCHIGKILSVLSALGIALHGSSKWKSK